MPLFVLEGWMADALLATLSRHLFDNERGFVLDRIPDWSGPVLFTA
jgi:hypothetical protein